MESLTRTSTFANSPFSPRRMSSLKTSLSPRGGVPCFMASTWAFMLRGLRMPPYRTTPVTSDVGSWGAGGAWVRSRTRDKARITIVSLLLLALELEVLGRGASRGNRHLCDEGLVLESL